MLKRVSNAVLKKKKKKKKSKQATQRERAFISINVLYLNDGY